MRRILAFAILCAAAPAFAQGYIGGGLGSAKATIADCGIQGFSCSTNDKASAFKIFGGYRLNKNISFEGGYLNVGQFTQTASGTINGTRVDAKGKIEGDGVFADVIFTAPVNETFGLFARVGFLSWDVTAKANASGGGRTASNSATASGVSPGYGVGIKIAASEKVDLRGELQRYKNVGDESTTGRSDIDVVSASVLFRFR